MQNDKIYQPENYKLLWFLIGAGLLITIISWYIFILIYTRKKKNKSIANLDQIHVVKPDLTALKSKYLLLVNEIETKLQSKQITARFAHQQLSLLLRFFAHEASGLKVQVFTLSDLKKSKFTNLTAVIEVYYPPEFYKIENGNIDNSVSIAKDLINKWS